jgi:hypothetical protein
MVDYAVKLYRSVSKEQEADKLRSFLKRNGVNFLEKSVSDDPGRLCLWVPSNTSTFSTPYANAEHL